MRCPKCQWIIAEYNPVCPQCGEDLSEVTGKLGPFYEPRPEAFPQSFLEMEETSAFEDKEKTPKVQPDLAISQTPSETSLELPEEESMTKEEPELEIPFSEGLFIEEIPESSETKAEPSPLENLELEELSPEKKPEKEKLLEEMPDIEELLPPELKEPKEKK